MDIAAAKAALADLDIDDNPAAVRAKSRDFFWYSPVLKDRLDHLSADFAVMPRNQDEVIRVLAVCHAHDVPVTVRGSGTGNYGQAMPLAGGCIMHMQNMAEVLERLRELLIGSVLMLDGNAIAIQLVYRVEAPEWVSVEYINGGVDPETKAFSPGSVLSFLNTQAAWDDAQARNKPLRFSFGRADREYKDRWCNPVPVFQV